MLSESTLSPPFSPCQPGLFDLQVNGFSGIDFQQPNLGSAAFHQALVSLHAHGIRLVLPTLITSRMDALCRQLEHLEKLRAADPLAASMIPGYHVEGPWLNPTPGFRGAHPAEFMVNPRVGDLVALQSAAGGRLRLITLAPERPGSDEVIAAAVADGITVSLGHTDATEAQIEMAIAAGARLCTHLGNGVPATLPRHDNIIQRLLSRDELTACLIPDGHHLPPFMLRNLFRAKPPGRVILTSDAMAAAGMPPGRYTLGCLELEVGADGIVREPGQPNFAGSSLTLDRGVADAARWLGIDLTAAWALGSTTVADVFGLSIPSI